MQHQYDSVVGHVSTLWEAGGDSSSLLLKLYGISQCHQQNYELAIKALEQVIAKNQTTEVVHYYLGLAYRNLGKLDKSVVHFDEAISTSTSENLGAYYTNLAVSYEEQGDLSKSIRAYQAAYAHSSKKELLYHLARNYDAYYKDKRTALRYYERYLAENDTDHVTFGDYSMHRISELKEVMHFELDTID